MRYLKDIGFVIKRVNIGEADRYVTLFSKQHGKTEVMAKGVRKITSRRASSIELLNLIRFQSVKSHKNYVLTEVELIDSFEYVKKSLSNVSAVFLICELIDKLCPYSQKHEDIFELLKNTIDKIQRVQKVDTVSRGVNVFHLGGGTALHLRNVLFNFQTELLARLGFWDRKRQFKDEEDLKNFIENIIERKIKTKIYA